MRAVLTPACPPLVVSAVCPAARWHEQDQRSFAPAIHAALLSAQGLLASGATAGEIEDHVRQLLEPDRHVAQVDYVSIAHADTGVDVTKVSPGPARVEARGHWRDLGVWLWLCVWRVRRFVPQPKLTRRCAVARVCLSGGSGCWSRTGRAPSSTVGVVHRSADAAGDRCRPAPAPARQRHPSVNTADLTYALGMGRLGGRHQARSTIGWNKHAVWWAGVHQGEPRAASTSSSVTA